MAPTPEPTTHAIDPVGASPSPSVFFPRQAVAAKAAHPSLLVGELVLDDEGCLRVRYSKNDAGHLPIWPPGLAPRVEGDQVRVVDRSGRVVARVGDAVYIEARKVGAPSRVRPPLRQPVPSTCPGSYFLVAGDVRSLGSARSDPPLDFDDAATQDAAYYAAGEGITLVEALRRFRVEDSWRGLGATLEANERETFGGLWIQHEPEHRVVVAFTRDGEETIRPYIEGRQFRDAIEVRRVEATHAEILAAQAEAGRVLASVGVRASSGTDITKNRAEVYVTDKALVEAKLRAAGKRLPKHAVLVQREPPTDQAGESMPEPDPAPPAPGVLFPAQDYGGGAVAHMDALLTGTLIEENGCLLVKAPGDTEGIVPIWPEGFKASASDDEIQVLDGAGRVVARVGEEVRMGGGGVGGSLDGVAGLNEQLARELERRCPRSYWLVGQFPIDLSR